MARRLVQSFVFAVLVAETVIRSVSAFAAPGVAPPVAHWRFNETSGNIAHDTSANHNHGTLENMNDSAWTSGKYGNGLAFDGVDDRVLVPHSPTIDFGDSDFAVCFWMNETPVSYEHQYLVKGTIHAYVGDPGTSTRYQIYYKNQTLRFAIDDGYVKSQLETSSSLFITGEWVHLAAVRDTVANEIRLYANADLAGVTADVTGDISQEENLCLGQANSLYAFPAIGGLIDDVRIYDFALTQAQIASVMANEDPDPTPIPTPTPLGVSPDLWVLY
jgi:hypothetical protein